MGCGAKNSRPNFFICVMGQENRCICKCEGVGGNGYRFPGVTVRALG